MRSIQQAPKKGVLYGRILHHYARTCKNRIASRCLAAWRCCRSRNVLLLLLRSNIQRVSILCQKEPVADVEARQAEEGVKGHMGVEALRYSWVASDYLDNDDSWGILDDDGRIIIGYSARLGPELAKVVANAVNEYRDKHPELYHDLPRGVRRPK